MGQLSARQHITPRHAPTSGPAVPTKKAVDIRQDQLLPEYKEKAIQKDYHIFNTPVHIRGPLEQALAQHNFGGVVFGNFGEASQNTRQLVHAMASATPTPSRSHRGHGT